MCGCGCGCGCGVVGGWWYWRSARRGKRCLYVLTETNNKNSLIDGKVKIPNQGSRFR